MSSDSLTAAELAAIRLIARIVREARRTYPDAELCIAASLAPQEYQTFMRVARRLNLVHLNLEAALSALELADTCMLRRAA